jgi:hypothetical protein
MLLRSISVSIGLAGLTGCGGSGAPATLPPAFVADGIGAPVVSRNASTGEVTVIANGVTHTLPTNPDIDDDEGFFVAARNLVYDSGALVHTSDDSIAAVVYVTPFTNAVAGTYYARLTDTELPATGTANYDGFYSGMLFLENGNFQSRVTGDVALSINFDNATIQGDITNRALRGLFNSTASLGSVDNVALLQTAIGSDGSFSGSASGGTIGNLSNDMVNGSTYEGLIAGTDGGHTVGAVRIGHTDGFQNLVERGAFGVDPLVGLP